MKAGGLNAVAVYVFWIHHEEIEGRFNFTGRRDVRSFFKLVGELNMSALLRAGPWDHGECRNGGHPDWVLAKATAEKFQLRSNNTGCANDMFRYAAVTVFLIASIPSFAQTHYLADSHV